MIYLDCLENPQRHKNNFWVVCGFLFILIIIGCLLSSCATKKRCNRKYPPEIHDTIITVTKDSIVHHRDTTFEEGEVIFVHDSIPCPDFKYHSTIKKNGLTGSIDISKGKITFKCAEDSILRIKDSLVTYIRTNITDRQTKIIPPEIKYMSHWYDIVCRWLAGIFALLLVGFTAGKIK